MFTHALGMLQVVLGWTQFLHSWTQVHSAQLQLTTRCSYIMSYIWRLESGTSDCDATCMMATHNYKWWAMHRLGYKHPGCNKYLHSSVTRYTTPDMTWYAGPEYRQIEQFRCLGRYCGYRTWQTMNVKVLYRHVLWSEIVMAEAQSFLVSLDMIDIWSFSMRMVVLGQLRLLPRMLALSFQMILSLHFERCMCKVVYYTWLSDLFLAFCDWLGRFTSRYVYACGYVRCPCEGHEVGCLFMTSPPEAQHRRWQTIWKSQSASPYHKNHICHFLLIWNVISVFVISWWTLIRYTLSWGT